MLYYLEKVNGFVCRWFSKYLLSLQGSLNNTESLPQTGILYSLLFYAKTFCIFMRLLNPFTLSARKLAPATRDQNVKCDERAL